MVRGYFFIGNMKVDLIIIIIIIIIIIKVQC